MRLVFAIFVLVLVALSSAEVQTSESHPSIEVRHFVAPDYPQMARVARLEGDVKATVTVGSDGSIQSLLLASAYPLLRQPVEGALEHWTFEPPSHVTTTDITIQFRLDCSTRVTADFPKLVKVSACPPTVETNTD